jgi:hypothetical protein
MRPLSTAELLSVWERGQARPPVERALALLAAACPEETPDELARLSIGRRDGLLMTLREWTFGPRLVSLATCPDCGERLELDMAVADLRVPSAGPAPERLEMAVDGYEISLRLPDSRDLAAISGESDLPALRQRLLGRCLLAVRCHGEEASLPAELTEAAVARLAEADPQADVQLAPPARAAAARGSRRSTSPPSTGARSKPGPRASCARSTRSPGRTAGTRPRSSRSAPSAGRSTCRW